MLPSKDTLKGGHQKKTQLAEGGGKAKSTREEVLFAAALRLGHPGEALGGLSSGTWPSSSFSPGAHSLRR